MAWLCSATMSRQAPDFRKHIQIALLVFAFAAAVEGAPPCPRALDVQAGATLEDLASQYLGGPRYAIAIALATNARSRQDGFLYIANPDDLTGIARVCIPSKSEAHRLERSW